MGAPPGDRSQPTRVAAVVEVDSGQLGVDSAMAELQQLQELLTLPERDNLIAIVSLSEMVVLKPALNHPRALGCGGPPAASGESAGADQ
ncbi:Sugar diacid regulator [Serratia fonticola]|uniref:Sugar diacid regulator n=1 Tax=Serratia fonticola TaxID=47917 RepID=A0A4U9VCR5_SERFO|nr:Sugar diacid regulator [Serratia fonticola]